MARGRTIVWTLEHKNKCPSHTHLIRKPKKLKLKTVEFLRENDNEQIMVSDLTEKMSHFLGGEGAYGPTHMRAKLK